MLNRRALSNHVNKYLYELERELDEEDKVTYGDPYVLFDGDKTKFDALMKSTYESSKGVKQHTPEDYYKNKNIDNDLMYEDRIKIRLEQDKIFQKALAAKRAARRLEESQQEKLLYEELSDEEINLNGSSIDKLYSCYIYYIYL